MSSAWLKRLLGGEGQSLDRDDLLSQVVSGIAALGHVGARGREVYPAAVRVALSVPEADVTVVDDFTKAADFDREIEARLLNRMTDPDPSALPLRFYAVQSGEQLHVEVKADTTPPRLQFRVEGGDRDGAIVAVPVGRQEIRLGRTAAHGDSGAFPNDVVITHEDKCVSRAAARIRRTGTSLEIESKDQGTDLIVLCADGRQIRPANTARGWLRFDVGDVIAFSDGRLQRIKLHVEAYTRDETQQMHAVDEEDAITERLGASDPDEVDTARIHAEAES